MLNIRLSMFFSAAFACAFFSFPAESAEKNQRIHLSSFKAVRNDVELEATSHLDVGIEEVSDSMGTYCRILSPGTPTADEKLWAPLDFYTQLNAGDETKFAKVLGRADVFFDGDDFNRNGDKDAGQKTRRLADTLRGSLKFVQKSIAPSRDRVSVVVEFLRGALKFEGLMEVRAWRTAGGCDAGLFFCPSSKVVEGKRICPDKGWTHRILQISAVADEAGYASDKVSGLFSFSAKKEHEKNDVYSLEALTIGADETPDSGEKKKLTLVTK